MIVIIPISQKRNPRSERLSHVAQVTQHIAGECLSWKLPTKSGPRSTWSLRQHIGDAFRADHRRRRGRGRALGRSGMTRTQSIRREWPGLLGRL